MRSEMLDANKLIAKGDDRNPGWLRLVVDNPRVRGSERVVPRVANRQRVAEMTTCGLAVNGELGGAERHARGARSIGGARPCNRLVTAADHASEQHHKMEWRRAQDA